MQGDKDRRAGCVKHKIFLSNLKRKSLQEKERYSLPAHFTQRTKEQRFLSFLKKKIYEINFQNHRNFLKKKKMNVWYLMQR